MSDLLDVQVELFPVLLRRLAAGERLASESDDTEKLAASLLVAEAIENQRTSSEDETPAEQPREEKKAVLAELGVGALLGAAATKIKPLIQKLRGTPEIEGGGELIKSFRDIIRSQQEAQSAKRKLLLAGVGGAAVGALATKALEKKKESSATPVEEVKSADVAVSNIEEEKPIEQKTPETKNARAVLDRLLKNFA